MKWIILIGNDNLDINTLKNIDHFGSKKISILTPNRMVVDYGSEHIFYEYSEDVVNDYENEELELIPFGKLHFIIMTYKSEELMKSILRQNNFLKDIYVDDNNGKILPIEQFNSI